MLMTPPPPKTGAPPHRGLRDGEEADVREAQDHFAISLLNFSIQAARSGLIFAQSCCTYAAISSRFFIGMSAASGTSLLTGRKLYGGLVSPSWASLLITRSRYL